MQPGLLRNSALSTQLLFGVCLCRGPLFRGRAEGKPITPRDGCRGHVEKRAALLFGTWFQGSVAIEWIFATFPPVVCFPWIPRFERLKIVDPDKLVMFLWLAFFELQKGHPQKTKNIILGQRTSLFPMQIHRGLNILVQAGAILEADIPSKRPLQSLQLH